MLQNLPCLAFFVDNLELRSVIIILRDRMPRNLPQMGFLRGRIARPNAHRPP
jgi:hypothetical protein